MEFILNASQRSSKGSSAAKAARRDNVVPGIIYGSDIESINITVQKNELAKNMSNEAFYSQILSIQLDDGTEQKVILKDVQRHPYKKEILHLDFLQVNENKEIKVTVPFHFINEDKAPGVKIGGGLVSHLVNEIEIVCLPKDIPEYIEVDLANLELDHSIHLKEINLPANIKSSLLIQSEENDMAIAVIHKAKEIKDEDPVDETAEASDGEADDAKDSKAKDEKSDNKESSEQKN